MWPLSVSDSRMEEGCDSAEGTDCIMAVIIVHVKKGLAYTHEQSLEFSEENPSSVSVWLLVCCLSVCFHLSTNDLSTSFFSLSLC